MPAAWAPSLPVPGTEHGALPPLPPALPNQLWSFSLPSPTLGRRSLAVVSVVQTGAVSPTWSVHLPAQDFLGFFMGKDPSLQRDYNVGGLLGYWANNSLLFSESILWVLTTVSKSRGAGSPVSAYPCLYWLRRKVLWWGRPIITTYIVINCIIITEV